MNLAVYRISLPGKKTASGAMRFINFECAYDDFDRLVDELNEDRIINGWSLQTRATSERGVFEVIGREAYALSKHGVALVEIPRVRLVEVDEQ